MMNVLNILSGLLFMLLPFVVIIGLIKPSLVIRWGEKRDRKTLLKQYGLAFFILIIIVVFTAPPDPYENTDLNITISNPADLNFVTNTDKISLAGNITIPTAKLLINDKKVKISEDGTFVASIDLQEGENTFNIVATHYSKEDSENLTIIRELTEEEKIEIERKRLEEEQRLAEEEQKRQEADALKNGLNITRSEIRSVFEDPSFGGDFKEGKPIDGLENYITTIYGTIIQLMGPGDNLKEVQAVSFLGSDTSENTLSLLVLVGVAKTIDSKSYDWISGEFKKIENNPFSEYSSSKVFGSRVFEFKYIPSSVFNSCTLTIKPVE